MRSQTQLESQFRLVQHDPEPPEAGGPKGAGRDQEVLQSGLCPAEGPRAEEPAHGEHKEKEEDETDRTDATY